ncbi:MAG: BglII/BstYI family type II restriction endonuclease [Balneolaceae bacterium]
MAIADLGSFINSHYEIREWRHATAVLKNDFPSEWADLMYVLTNFRLLKNYISRGGGNRSLVSRRIDGLFESRGWSEKNFQTEITVDGNPHPSPTHSVDNFKNGIAIEVEWNNKDPFFDRDLNNFRLLHQLQVVSVGIIITRCDELQDIFRSIDRGSSFGMATTHMGKLIPKMEGGGAAGCPVLAFGISKALYEPNQ